MGRDGQYSTARVNDLVVVVAGGRRCLSPDAESQACGLERWARGGLSSINGQFIESPTRRRPCGQVTEAS